MTKPIHSPADRYAWTGSSQTHLPPLHRSFQILGNLQYLIDP